MAGSDSPVRYAELHCVTNYSFLRGASHPEEMVRQATALGYRALAITDECSVSGVVRAHEAAKETGLKLIIGSEFSLPDGSRLVLLARSRQGYGHLCELITQARRRAPKGKYHLSPEDLTPQSTQDCLAIWLPAPPMLHLTFLYRMKHEFKHYLDALLSAGTALQRTFGHQHLWIGAERFLSDTDKLALQTVRTLAGKLSVNIVATGDVHMHVPARKKLQDTLTAIRLGKTVQTVGKMLQSNHERYLRPVEKLMQLFPHDWLNESILIANTCQFSLDCLRYEYPGELVPPHMTADQYLKHLVRKGLSSRYPEGPPLSILRQVRHELALIKTLGYAHYFLTIEDIVRFARRRGILCQGRGSAANSVVCFCLYITEVDPTQVALLFERFISKERNEPPDIDVDFEHERREEVIQYIYEKYGRHRAALTATIITYRPKSAIRDVGKALGMDLLFLEQLITGIDWRSRDDPWTAQLAAKGLTEKAAGKQLLELVSQLLGFPRHLSQHVGGFVISAGPMSQLVPIENASMKGRTVIQWDKNDLETLGLLKVDILALGMLSAIRKSLDYLRQYPGYPAQLEAIPKEDPAVYHMLQKGDSVGVFQVESRAQMSMLPRLKPSSYYDLVIQVAIVRPGPIQGDMVHPYLRRRAGLEPVTYPGKEIRQILERTLGVPIFQEQVIKLAMVAAGFTAGEADQLRRAMANWKRSGQLAPFQNKLINGMKARGHSEAFARRLCQQISGFGEYGFPESHAASFALLVYTSAWLKCHHPAAFCCGLLNSLPMGFYSASQLIQDAQRHGVRILPCSVNHSHWHHELAYADDSGQPSIRLGLRMIRGLKQEVAEQLIARRPGLGYQSVGQLHRLAGLSRHDLETLASADALQEISGHRYASRWHIREIPPERPLLTEADQTEEATSSGEGYLPAPSAAQSLKEDYMTLGLSIDHHPLRLLRERARLDWSFRWVTHCIPAARLTACTHGQWIQIAGLVTGKQRPGSASGVTFVTLEDETGTCNVVVWQATATAQRQALLKAKLLQVTGTLEREGSVLHIIAGRLTDRTSHLAQLFKGTFAEGNNP